MTMPLMPGVLALALDAVILGVPAGVITHAWRTRLRATHALPAVIWRIVPPASFVSLVATALLARLFRATDSLDPYIPWAVSCSVEIVLFAGVMLMIWRTAERIAYPPQEAAQ
jgi:hypothetical protein